MNTILESRNRQSYLALLEPIFKLQVDELVLLVGYDKVVGVSDSHAGCIHVVEPRRLWNGMFAAQKSLRATPDTVICYVYDSTQLGLGDWHHPSSDGTGVMLKISSRPTLALCVCTLIFSTLGSKCVSSV